MWARRLEGLLCRFSSDRGQPPLPYRIIVGKTLIGRVWSLFLIALQCTVEFLSKIDGAWYGWFDVLTEHLRPVPGTCEIRNVLWV